MNRREALLLGAAVLAAPEVSAKLLPCEVCAKPVIGCAACIPADSCLTPLCKTCWRVGADEARDRWGLFT